MYIPIPTISTLVSAILFNFIIFDSTGSSLDNIIDASLTISFINVVGSLDARGVARKGTNKIIRNWKSSKYRKNCFFDGWTPPHPTFYAKRNCYIEFGSFNIQYKISSDIDLMFRFLEIYNLKSKYIDKYSVLMESGGLSNKNFINKIKLNLEIIQILKKENKSFSIISFLIKKLILKSRQYF